MISIVICSIDAKRFEAVRGHYERLLSKEPHEIIGIHDAKSLAEGYNRGLGKSGGEIVVFSHDDIEILIDDFAERLKGHLENYDVIGVAGTNRLIGPRWILAGPPHIFGQVVHPNPQTGRLGVSIYGAPRRVMGGIKAMDGLFLAFRRTAAEKIGWDETTFNGFHCYDLDTTFRAHLAGFRLAVANDLPMVHLSAGAFSKTWEHYAQLFMQRHGAKLDVISKRGFQIGGVEVGTKAEAVEVMTPGYWKEAMR